MTGETKSVSLGRAVFVADLRDAFWPQPVNLAAGPLQPPGYEGLATLSQGSIDLLEQVVGAFAHRHIAQDDLPVWHLDRRQAARPVNHGGHRLDGCLQVVALPARWNLAVVRGEEIGAQLVLVLEAASFTFVVVGVAPAP